MNSEPFTDSELQELVCKAQEGDTESFGKVYDHFFASVYRYTAFRLPRELTEDTVADVFLKAWEKLHTYKVHHNIPFGAWLFRIARYAIIDVYRAQRGFEEVPETLPDTDPLNQADASLKQRELLRIMRKGLSELPKRYREILLLTFVSELSHREAARVLRMTEGGVRILKLRALKKLETLLPPDIAFEA